MHEPVIEKTSGSPHASLHAALFTIVMLGLSALALSHVDSYKLAQDHDLVRGQLARDFETHYDEHFPAKTLGVNLWAAIDYTLFHEGRPGVVLGRDSWLYTDEEFTVGNDAQRNVERNLALVAWINGQLAERGIRLLVAVVPSKARVYPEHLAGREPPLVHDSAYWQAALALSAAGVPTANLLSALTLGKARHETYLRTDTHWTAYGAQLAAGAVAEAALAAGLVRDVGTEFRTQETAPQTHRGDLFNYLPLDPWFSALLPPTETIVPTSTEAVAQGNDLFGDDSAPKITLVGTSYSANRLWNFAGALKQALHEDLLNYAKDGKGPFAPMLDYLNSDDIKQAPPRLVIWEIPERYLPAAPALETYVIPPEAYATAGRNTPILKNRRNS